MRRTRVDGSTVTGVNSGERGTRFGSISSFAGDGLLALARAPDWMRAEPDDSPLEDGTEAAPEEVVRGIHLLKQVAGSAYRRPSLDHLRAYWAETRWRMVHIGADDAYRATVLALLTAGPIPYSQLTRHPGHRPAASRA